MSDYRGDRLLLLDDDLTLDKAIPTGHRPYGVIFDAKRRWFWVTLFESACRLMTRRASCSWMWPRPRPRVGWP